MATRTLQEKQAIFAEHHKKSADHHNNGDLNAALKALKKAARYVTSAEQKKQVQNELSELKLMIRFISDADNSLPPWKEYLKDFWELHALKVYGVLILGALIILGSVSLQALKKPSFSVEMSEEEKDRLKERFAQGDGNMTNTKMFGETEKDANGTLEIKASDSYLEITIPKELQSPFPERFIGVKSASIYTSTDLKSEKLGTLPQNTPVYLLDKTDDEAWIFIRPVKGEKPFLNGWVQLKSLSDSRILSRAEIDSQIKSQLGNRYWEIEIKGKSMPFRYFLIVNAPDTKKAAQGLINGFETYAKKQLLELHNWQSMDKYSAFQVLHMPPVITEKDVKVTFRLTGVKSNGELMPAGTKTLSVTRNSNQRFYLKEPLKGM